MESEALLKLVELRRKELADSLLPYGIQAIVNVQIHDTTNDVKSLVCAAGQIGWKFAKGSYAKWVESPSDSGDTTIFYSYEPVVVIQQNDRESMLKRANADDGLFSALCEVDSDGLKAIEDEQHFFLYGA